MRDRCMQSARGMQTQHGEREGHNDTIARSNSSNLEHETACVTSLSTDLQSSTLEVHTAVHSIILTVSSKYSLV